MSGHQVLYSAMISAGLLLAISGCRHDFPNQRDPLHQRDIKNPIILTPKNTQEKINLVLFQAVQKENLEAVKALLDQGADPNYKRPYGNLWRHYIGMQLISETTEEMTVLMSACAYGNSRTVELLIQRGANVNAQDNIGYTPLIWAAIAEKVDNVAILLKHHAKLNLQEKSMGFTALDEATGNPQIVPMLQKAGGKYREELKH